MQVSETGSGSSSGTTSTTAPENKEKDKAKSSSSMGEAAYLAAQAEAAKQAMANTWDELKHSVLSAGDLRQWTKQYPWIATGTALAAGVAAGYFLTPRDKDEFKEMWEKLKEKLTPSKGDEDAVYVEATNGKTAKAAQKPSILSTIAREAVKAVVPMLSSLVGGAMGSGHEAASHNGAHGSDEANPT